MWEVFALSLQSGFLSEHQQQSEEERILLQMSLKQLLDLRHEEVTQLRREQKAIGTFLSMCRKVQKYVRGKVLGEQSESGNSRKQHFP